MLSFYCMMIMSLGNTLPKRVIWHDILGKVSRYCAKQNSQRQCSVEHDGRLIQQRQCIMRSCHKLQAAKAVMVTCSNIGIIKCLLSKIFPGGGRYCDTHQYHSSRFDLGIVRTNINQSMIVVNRLQHEWEKLRKQRGTPTIKNSLQIRFFKRS